MTVPQMSFTLRSFAAEPPTTWAPMVDLARAADGVGVDRIVLSEHVVYGEDLGDYADPAKGGVANGRQPTGPDGVWLDPLITIAHLTAVTERIRFGTNILLAALRRPVTLAKSVSTIDVLSGSRIDLGVGVGWQRAEYEAAGLDFDRRGILLDHTLAVCSELWANDRASYDGEGLRFEHIHQYPKPLQRGVPLWVSGTVQRRSMERLARWGSVWIPWGADSADLVAAIPRMRVAVAELGRDPAGIGVVGSVGAVNGDDGALDVAATLAPVPDLVAAGVTDVRLMVPLPSEVPEAEDLLGRLVTRFRTLTS